MVSEPQAFTVLSAPDRVFIRTAKLSPCGSVLELSTVVSPLDCNYENLDQNIIMQTHLWVSRYDYSSFRIKLNILLDY